MNRLPPLIRSAKPAAPATERIAVPSGGVSLLPEVSSVAACAQPIVSEARTPANAKRCLDNLTFAEEQIRASLKLYEGVLAEGNVRFIIAAEQQFLTDQVVLKREDGKVAHGDFDPDRLVYSEDRAYLEIFATAIASVPGWLGGLKLRVIELNVWLTDRITSGKAALEFAREIRADSEFVADDPV